MAIRKEQVLALLALATVGMCSGRYFGTPELASRFSPTKVGYEPPAVAPASLATAAAAPAVRRDFCTEPSETQPLPPRDLDFPPRSVLSIASLPLDIGPDYAHMWMLRIDGTPVEGAVINQGDGSAAAAAPAGGATPGGTAAPEPAQDRAALVEQAARTYDRIWVSGITQPYVGTIEADGQDLYALEEAKDFTGVKLRMREFSIEKQRMTVVQEFGQDTSYRIERIALAGTLRNEIARQTRKVGSYDLDERRKLIDWLLDKAREETSVYDVALQQAEAFGQLAGAGSEGVRLQRRVLRAKGDLAGELALLEGLPASGPDASFRFEGLGIVKARLCLWAEAEADLRKAGELKPTDARPHAALAEFLRVRGRSREAVAVATRAEQTLGSVPDAVEKARVARVILACRLAVGDVAGARTALGLVPKGPQQSYLEGCVEYAAGQMAPAIAAFQKAAGSDDENDAQLGQAACMIREAKWQEAYDLLQRVYNQAPALRHRAATGLALVFLRTGQYEAATQWLDRALEADPQDPYAHYLRGRTLRFAGQTQGAADALAMALQKRDDFVHALAEMAAVQATRVLETRGEEQRDALVSARRYIERASSFEPEVELLELQGLAAFHAGDAKAAEAAFTKARNHQGADDREKWYLRGCSAVVAYSRGVVDEAEMALSRIESDLGTTDALGKWAAATRAAIDDHAQKETLGDSFDRDDLGNVWAWDTDGALGPKVKNGQVELRGSFTRGHVTVQRENAVKRGLNFLAVGATIQQIGQGNSEAFSGLGIEMSRGSGGTDLLVRVGIREGVPRLVVEDGRDQSGKPVNVQQDLTIAGFDPRARHTLELRVVPVGDDQSKQLTLFVSWNGAIVHRRDLIALTRSTSSELKTVLFATGDKGRQVDVAFDDYRLERRKDAKR